MAHIRSTGRQFSRKTLLKQGLLSSKDLLAGLHQPGSEKWVVCDLYETLTFSKFKTIIFFKFLEAWQHRIHRQHQLWIAKYITVSHRKWLLFLEITLFWEEWNLALQGKHFNHKMKNVQRDIMSELKNLPATYTAIQLSNFEGKQKLLFAQLSSRYRWAGFGV